MIYYFITLGAGYVAGIATSIIALFVLAGPL